MKDLDSKSLEDIKKRETRAMQRMRLADWMDMESRKRTFGSQVCIEFIKIRPDKRFPNTLTVIVSTLAESLAIDMDTLVAAMRPAPKAAEAKADAAAETKHDTTATETKTTDRLSSDPVRSAVKRGRSS